MKRFILLTVHLTLLAASIFAQEKKDWLKATQFSVTSFNNPPQQYAPLTRWWWPGNDVEVTELKREVNLFADHHFGGIEIQPIALVNPIKSKEQSARIQSFDSPEYYKNVEAVLEEAQKRGLIVDMTVGSGWPSGGEHISEEESNLTLKYATTDIPQNQTGTITIPKLDRNHHPSAKLVALLVAKVRGESNGTLILDQQSVDNITSSVQDDGTFSYKANGEGYKAIAIWSISAREMPMLMAKRKAGLVVNHFDGKAIQKNYEYYFGERTNYAKYFGRPLRALFNDSYEFKIDRHFSEDFIDTFKARRGYDPTLTLPANLWDGYNNMYARMQSPDRQPAFAFGKEDWRMRYDYDMTLSDILRKQFLDTSSQWTNQRGLLHRSQGYGINMDIMGVAGSIDIPEGETMLFNYGSEAGYKLITSGAHLYNKPIVTSESAVFSGRALLTTPQKLKLVTAKIVSAGVNQLIGHGSPYYYTAEGQSPEGWRPYYIGVMGVNFSSEIYEGNEFWGNISDVNHYAQRAQYVLRSGKPKADVLIYYPFLNFSDETYNPKELLAKGYIPGVEPEMNISSRPNAYSNTACTEWLNQIYPLINRMNALGLTWDWINDESMQVMTLEANKQLNVRGNLYEGIILFNLPYMQLPSAQHLQELAIQGAKVLTIGELAHIQPSYKDYENNDRLITSAMLVIKESPSTKSVANIIDADTWLSGIYNPLQSMNGQDVVKPIRREMENGDLVQFYYNESYEWNTLQVQIDKRFKHAYWMDAEDGSIRKAVLKNGMVSTPLKPLGSIFLYVSQWALNISTNSKQAFNPATAKTIFEQDVWTLKVGDMTFDNMKAQDWREVEELKYENTPGEYQITIPVEKLDKKAHYYLDLGEVYYTASLKVNGHEAGERIWKPYMFDITPYLQKGDNNIEVTISPSRYNSLVKRAIDGEDTYKSLKDSPLASEGMTGKCKLYLQR